MKKLLILLSAFMVISCSDDDQLPYDNLTQGPKIVGFKSTVANVAYFSNVGVVEFKYPIAFIGNGDGLTLPTTDIMLDYEVDAANSTAVDGVEYTFSDNTKKVKIAAGSDFGTLNIKVNTGQLNATSKTQLVLKLKTNPAVTISRAQQSIKIIFVGCATALQGTYNTFLVVGATSTFSGQAIVTKIAPNVYRSTRLPGISSGGQPLTFDFSDVCKDLEITEWEFEGAYRMFKTGTENDRPTGVIESPIANLYFTGVNLSGLSFYTNRNFRMVKL